MNDVGYLEQGLTATTGRIAGATGDCDLDELLAAELSGVDYGEAFGFGAHQLDFFVKRVFQLACQLGGAVVVFALVKVFEKLLDSALKRHGPLQFLTYGGGGAIPFFT